MKARDLVRVPWKNRGGTTAEIAVSPEGAGFEAFEWRLSMADVGTNGPFSSFSGIDRTLVLIEGRGLELTVDGVTCRLDRVASLLAFAGESITAARLTGGPIRDLNVMTRRGRYEHQVEKLEPGIVDLRLRRADVIAIMALNGPTAVDFGSEVHQLDHFDVALATSGGPLALDKPGLLIRIWRAGEPPASPSGRGASRSSSFN